MNRKNFMTTFVAAVLVINISMLLGAHFGYYPEDIKRLLIRPTEITSIKTGAGEYVSTTNVSGFVLTTAIQGQVHQTEFGKFDITSPCSGTYEERAVEEFQNGYKVVKHQYVHSVRFGNLTVRYPISYQSCGNLHSLKVKSIKDLGYKVTAVGEENGQMCKVLLHAIEITMENGEKTYAESYVTMIS